jgi:hypothetical protein
MKQSVAVERIVFASVERAYSYTLKMKVTHSSETMADFSQAIYLHVSDVLRNGLASVHVV